METAIARLVVLRMRPDETLFVFNTSVIWASAAETVRLRVCIDGGRSGGAVWRCSLWGKGGLDEKVGEKLTVIK